MVHGLRRRGPRTPPGRNEGPESPATAQVSPAPEPPQQHATAQRRRGGRRAGDTAPNKGKRHDTDIRQQVWDAWQRCVGRDKQLRGKRGLASAGGTKQLQDICRLLGPPGGAQLYNQVAWCRRWIGRKLADPDFDLRGNASGAGGATDKHPHPPVSESARKEIRRTLKTKRHGSCKRTMLKVNKTVAKKVAAGKNRRKIRSAKTVHNIAKEVKMHWVLGKTKHRQAGQRVGDAEKRVRFCQQMKAIAHRQKELVMSDEKIFAMSELHGGGVWCEEGEEPPHQDLWQSQVKWHVWGGITWYGTLPLQFLEGGTFKGENRWKRDLEKLKAEKARQKRCRTPTAKQIAAVGHSYNKVIDTALTDLDIQYAAEGYEDGFVRGAEGIWQQDGAPPHWGQDSLEHLEAHGISVEQDNLLVEDESGKWPARSPDLNWLDEFVWGFCVNEIRFEEATTKDELKAAIIRVWAKITPQMCRNMITHYWKSGGTLDKCIAAEGKRFSKPKLSAVVDDE